MGMLVEGRWTDTWYDTSSTGGRFVRTEAQFRNWITPDGAPGPNGQGGYKAEVGRYLIYVSLACPWAHRTLIMRALKGLDHAIDVAVVEPFMGANGWVFGDAPGLTQDPIHGAKALHEIYVAVAPNYTGRVTVPVLFDKQTQSIVNNESSEIIRMLNIAFRGIARDDTDYYPSDLADEINRLNSEIYPNINNGVYRAGFATSQSAYEEAFDGLFAALDSVDKVLGARRYLTGSDITEADIRLFTTLIRFDAVYVGHFKCNLRRIEDYPNLSGYTRELYQHPRIRPTVDFEHIKTHYYRSHETINPTRIVPKGPDLSVLDAPHGQGNRLKIILCFERVH